MPKGWSSPSLGFWEVLWFLNSSLSIPFLFFLDFVALSGPFRSFGGGADGQTDTFQISPVHSLPYIPLLFFLDFVALSTLSVPLVEGWTDRLTPFKLLPNISFHPFTLLPRLCCSFRLFPVLWWRGGWTDRQISNSSRSISFNHPSTLLPGTSCSFRPFPFSWWRGGWTDRQTDLKFFPFYLFHSSIYSSSWTFLLFPALSSPWVDGRNNACTD